MNVVTIGGIHTRGDTNKIIKYSDNTKYCQKSNF